MHVILTSQTAEEVSTFNVVGDLKGSEHPEQVVIVSGHLDSWDLGTGAIDDAAGVAVAMETAQLMQQLHLRPKRTLRVIACALLGLDVRLFRERIAQPVAAVTMFVVTNRTAQLTILGDRSHLSEDLKNQEGT